MKKYEGIHQALRSRTQEQLAAAQSELDEANIRLTEAMKLGDLSENAEYDTAKEEVRRLQNRVEELRPVLQMPVLDTNDMLDIIEPGCIVHLSVYDVRDRPLEVETEAFKRMTQGVEPKFEAELIYGGSLPVHELLKDYVLSENTPIGAGILGKPSGGMCIKVPTGFAMVVVKKVPLSGHKDADFFVRNDI